MARKPSESELMIQLLGYGILTPTFTLLVHPWVHTLAGNQTTLYVPPEACALVGTIVSSEGIPLNFPPSNNLSPVQVDTVRDPPQPRHFSDTDEWSSLSNREIIFLLQEDLVLNFNDITELGATKIEQLCEKFNKLTQADIRSLASAYIDRGLQDSSPEYLRGLQKVLRAIDRSISHDIRECSLQTQPTTPTTEEPDSTAQDDYLEQHIRTQDD